MDKPLAGHPTDLIRRRLIWIILGLKTSLICGFQGFCAGMLTLEVIWKRLTSTLYRVYVNIVVDPDGNIPTLPEILFVFRNSWIDSTKTRPCEFVKYRARSQQGSVSECGVNVLKDNLIRFS